MIPNKNCLLIFAKTPHAGFVKTRLMPTLNCDQAANLAEILLKHTLSIATNLTNIDIQLHILGDNHHSCFDVYRAHSRISLYQQQGNDLGARIAHALQTAFLHYEHVVIIGSDCAVITPDYIESAFIQLAQTTNAVIGPGLDGGYILLGLNHPYLTLFHHIPWSTESVLRITRQRLKMLGIVWSELPILWDIDYPDDLVRFHKWYLTHLNDIAALPYAHQHHEIFNCLR